MAFQRKSRMTGPLVVSFILCGVILDYTFYRQTNNSLLFWFWAPLADLFGRFSVSRFFSREALVLVAAIVGLGIVLTRLSLNRALQAMRMNASDEPVITPPVANPLTATHVLERKSLGSVFISYDRNDRAGFAHLIYERLNKRFPGRIVMTPASLDRGELARTVADPVESCEIVLVVLNDRADPGSHSDSSALTADQHRGLVSALRRGSKVIVVLAENARMPGSDELPQDISTVAESRSVRVADQTMVADIDRLIGLLEVELGENRQNPLEPLLNLFRPYWLYAGAIALAIFFIFMRELGILGF